MEKRIVYPYLGTVLLFITIYAITLLIANKILYLGLADDWLEVKENNKVPLQRAIFTFGLIAFLAAVNAFQILISKKDQTNARYSFSWLAIILIYSINALVDKLINIQVISLYNYPRMPTAYLLCIPTFIIMTALLLVLDALVAILSKFISGDRIRKAFSKWLMEKEAKDTH